MAFTSAPEKERFSLDDPDAGRKLIGNLDVRKVRLVFSELCWHFRCEDHDEKMRLRAFLLDLSMTGEIVEVLPNLYCRPSLTGGSSDPAARRKAIKQLRKTTMTARRGRKAASTRDEEAKSLHAFAAAQGERVARSALVAEGARIGLNQGRVSYLIQHLRETGALQSSRYGVYAVIVPEPSDDVPQQPAVLATDDA